MNTSADRPAGRLCQYEGGITWQDIEVPQFKYYWPDYIEATLFDRHDCMEIVDPYCSHCPHSGLTLTLHVDDDGAQYTEVLFSCANTDHLCPDQHGYKEEFAEMKSEERALIEELEELVSEELEKSGMGEWS